MAALPWSGSPWSTGTKPQAPTASSAFQQRAPAPPTPEQYAKGQAEGAASAGKAASAAGDYAAATHGMTPEQLTQYNMFHAMTPEQQRQYTVGQGAAETSAGKAAYVAGNLAAANVGPGGPNSVGAVADRTRQAEADAAGLDFMKPGMNERFMGAHGNDLLTGGPSDTFWKGYGTDLMGGGNSQQVFNEAQNNRPQLPSANLDPYYDRQRQLGTQKLSAAQASRGAYGSSVGVGQVGSMLADLGAQQAKDEADYGLKRSDLERNWMTARGDLASNADRDAISRWTATGSGAATADESAINRWRTTQQGAESAQGSQRTRGQDLFTNNLNLGNALAGPVGSSFEAGATQDQGTMDAIIKLGLAKDAAGVAEVMARMNSDQAFSKQVMDAIQAYSTSQAGKDKP